MNSSSTQSDSFVSLTNGESLKNWLLRSKLAPVVLFKHSLTCSISSSAYKEMERVHGDVGLIVIQTSRDVSSEVERVTGVSHESPQVIVIRDGEVVWTASHWNVNAEAVERAIHEAE